MKNLILAFALLLGIGCFSQANLKLSQDLGNIKVWEMSSNNTSLGEVYTLEKNANCILVFSPTNNDIANALLVMTGTYTSTTNQVAGFAYNANGKNIGDQTDGFAKKANSYLIFQNGIFSFSDVPATNSIQVYKLLENGSILSDVVNARTKNQFQWRFLVQKNWTRVYDNGKQEKGVDLLIVDFSPALTLNQACAYVKDLERNQKYQNFHYESNITACLLDTGMNYPFLLDDKNIHGTFSVAEQSNVIVVK